MTTVLATGFGDQRSGGLAGPMGLLIILLLAVATILLIRNMNARLRRLPERFPDPDRPEPPGRAGDGGAPEPGRPDQAAVDERRKHTE